MTKLSFSLRQYKLRCRPFWCGFLVHPLPETQKCQLKQNNCFIPRINLLTLRCFVAEVRWLFPVNGQRKIKPRKQRNTEPSLELNQITGWLKSVLRAHWLNSKNLFCSSFNGADYLYILFPFMVEIFACFSSRTSSPFQSESLYVQVQFQFLYIYLYYI